MEDLFENETCQQFECAREYDRARKQYDEIALERFESTSDENDSEAVDRAVWTVQKASVDETPVFKSLIHHLKTPPEKGIYHIIEHI